MCISGWHHRTSPKASSPTRPRLPRNVASGLSLSPYGIDVYKFAHSEGSGLIAAKSGRPCRAYVEGESIRKRQPKRLPRRCAQHRILDPKTERGAVVRGICSQPPRVPG